MSGLNSSAVGQQPEFNSQSVWTEVAKFIAATIYLAFKKREVHIYRSWNRLRDVRQQASDNPENVGTLRRVKGQRSITGVLHSALSEPEPFE